MVFVKVEEPVKKRPCVGKLSGYVKISPSKGIDCNNDTVKINYQP
jgi:hypothetical protein